MEQSRSSGHKLSAQACRVKLERRGAAAVVTVDRPEMHNALNTQMRVELLATVKSLRDDPDVRVVLFRGAGGKAFMSGADIKEFAEMSVEQFVESGELDQELLRAIEGLDVPAVALIEGYAMGNGFVLAAACDIRVCTPDSKFGLTGAKTLGNCLHGWGNARVATIIGWARLKELIILARPFSAETALAWGFVSEIIERAELEAWVTRLLEEVSAHSRLSMWAVKESMRRCTVDHPPDRDIRETVYGSEDFREGVAAFVERRAPRWADPLPTSR